MNMNAIVISTTSHPINPRMLMVGYVFNCLRSTPSGGACALIMSSSP